MLCFGVLCAVLWWLCCTDVPRGEPKSTATSRRRRCLGAENRSDLAGSVPAAGGGGGGGGGGAPAAAADKQDFAQMTKEAPRVASSVRLADLATPTLLKQVANYSAAGK